MLTINTFDVTSYDGESLQLSWEFETTEEVITNYGVNVFRSESSSTDIADYDLVASGINANEYTYVDGGVSQLLDLGRPWFYKLEIINNYTADTTYQPTDPAYLKDGVPDRVFREIVRRKAIVLNNTRYSGRNFKVFKRRSWGIHCSTCWDLSLQRSTDSKCPTCYGTGWINGYYNPVTIRGMKNTSPKLNQINMFGEWKPSDSLLFMLGNPPLKVRDIISDDNNHLWTVVQVRGVERLGYIVEQNAQLALIAQDDFLYKNLLSLSFTSGGGVAMTVVDTLITVDTTGGDQTETLPLASVFVNRKYSIKADDLSGGTVTIATTGDDTIDGTLSSIQIYNPYGYYTFMSDGIDWYII
ncbi:hypothetical protein LCGC14_2072420 [marine sediment metagenome]|uniref:Uncharacterized protein n=1 Tax=marine sediment metagenome TaxID=412755 RepID=A0A0F9EI64_9ZZZZ